MNDLNMNMTNMNTRLEKTDAAVRTLPKSVQFMSSACDDIVEEQAVTRSATETLNKQNKLEVDYLKNDIKKNIERVGSQPSDLHQVREDMIDIQWREMRNNLIFSGITEDNTTHKGNSKVGEVHRLGPHRDSKEHPTQMRGTP